MAAPPPGGLPLSPPAHRQSICLDAGGVEATRLIPDLVSAGSGAAAVR